MEHTATPWHLQDVVHSDLIEIKGADRSLICAADNEQDAAYIVRAVNNFEGLVEACRFALDALEDMTTEAFERGGDHDIRERLAYALARAIAP